MPVVGIVAGNEVLEGLPAQSVLLEREVLVGAKVVDPELLRPRRLARGLALEEEHVGLDALGVEDTCGEPQQGVYVVLTQQSAPHGLPCPAFEEHVVRYDDRGRANYLQEALDVLKEVELLVGGGCPEVVALVGLTLAYCPSVGSEHGVGALLAKGRV